MRFDKFNTDREVVEIVDDLPTKVPDIGEHFPANAYVCVNTRYTPPRIEIWPVDGAWLGVEMPHLQGDIAPWHG